jgi:hypothetical protein
MAQLKEHQGKESQLKEHHGDKEDDTAEATRTAESRSDGKDEAQGL